MVFIDILALEEVTLLIAAVVLAYVGLLGLFAMRRNDPAGLRSALRGAAVPVGGLGALATAFGVWGEMVWQYPSFMASYNILFNDVYTLFGLTFLILGVSLALGQKLQYAGLFGLVAGGVTIAYGYQGWHLGLTKEPFEMFLLFGAFGLAGILSMPATLVADHYLAYPETTVTPVGSAVSVARRQPSIQTSVRAAQPITPTTSEGTPDESVAQKLVYHLPLYVSVPVLVFVVSMGLAAVAALFFLDSTLPAHLASAP